jgi:hypothetical protein
MAKFAGAAARLGLFRVAEPWFKRGIGRRAQQVAGVGDDLARGAGRAARGSKVPLAGLRADGTHMFDRASAALTDAEQAAMRAGHKEVSGLLAAAGRRPLSRYETRVALRHVNPTGSTRNCSEVSLAVDDILAGRAAVAGPLKGAPIPVARGVYATRAIDTRTGLSSLDDVERLIAQNPGARGVIVAHGGEGAGHVFNVANVGGKTSFLDGQLGRMFDANPHAGKFPKYDFYRTA